MGTESPPDQTGALRTHLDFFEEPQLWQAHASHPTKALKACWCPPAYAENY